MATWFFIFYAGFSASSHAQKIIAFDSLHWDLSRAQVTEHLGRTAITGTATLKDIVFQNGIIEVDIATTPQTRSYPAILFRKQDPATYERIYIRPHRSVYYDDALQYAPSFHGVDSWQLYSGPGKSGALDIPSGEWNHLKIMVSKDRADVYWNDDPKPALIIDRLDHGMSEGAIELMNPQPGSAFYADFSVLQTDSALLVETASSEPVCGVIANWEVSIPYPLLKTDLNQYPEAILTGLSWQQVSADSRGLVDLSRYYSRQSRAGDCIFAKTVIHADKDTLLLTGFGYSDYITVYLNKQPLFSGNSAYRSRDNSFLGIVGYNDYLFLPLKAGDNELALQVGETMGGWAFCFRSENEVCMAPHVEKQFTLKEGISVPEAVLYDPQENVCYVANYFNEGREYLSKISPEGKMIETEWISGLRMPTGMCLQDGTLYSVDRTGVNVIDISEGKIRDKIPLPGVLMPNDIAVDSEGVLYISDSPGNAVYRYADNQLEQWLGPDLLQSPNALLVDGNQLLVGQNEKLYAVSIPDKQVKTLVTLEQGSNVDGIQCDGQGNYLISDYNGKLYRVTISGEKTLLLNTATIGDQMADFAYIPSLKLVVIPTLTKNSITGYTLDRKINK